MGAGLEVWKFGGASVADGRAIQRAADQIAAHRGPLVVVVSALAGVTDLLLDAGSGRGRCLPAQASPGGARARPAGRRCARLLAQIDASAR